MDSTPTSDILRALALFRHLDDDALAELEGELQWFALPGGALLFEQGDPSDALYVLKSGSLGAFRDQAGVPSRLIGVVAAGETIGEVGLIIDRPRSASARALRDSELLRLSRAAFDKLVARHPQAMLDTARLALRRMSAAGETVARASVPRTFAVLPHDHGVDARGFAAGLAEALGAFGETALVDAALGAGQLSHWFSDLEARTRFVVYVADRDAEWQSLCVRQADCLLLAANAADTPHEWPAHACADASSALSRPRHLILLHAGDLVRGAASRWLGLTAGVTHHHVRDAHDVRRVARLLTGRSLGLVLSGGGARGFAQIGVVRALREAGLEIDCVGGTSIGAIIGAGVALEWSDEEMFDNYQRNFVAGRPLSDYTLPLVALTRGSRVAHLLRTQFEARDITDLALPFFCCSSNLSTGVLDTHRDGPLWLWLRASCAIPGVLPPVCHRGQVYVDGAVMNNLPTDIMASLHPGAIAAIDIGAGVALEWSDEEMFDNYQRNFVAGRPLSDYTLPLVALTRGSRVAHLLRTQFEARDITDLALPFFCCSSNLSTGVLDTHRDGPLWLWLRASCAIPGVLPPVCHRGQVYVDGAVMNNLPTDVMASLHPGAIVAIDIGAGDPLHASAEEHSTPSWWRMLLERGSGKRPGIVDILVRSGMVNAELASAERRKLASLLLAPPVRETGLLDWRAYERTVEAGYQHALRILGGRKDNLLEQVPVAV